MTSPVERAYRRMRELEDTVDHLRSDLVAVRAELDAARQVVDAVGAMCSQDIRFIHRPDVDAGDATWALIRPVVAAFGRYLVAAGVAATNPEGGQ